METEKARHEDRVKQMQEKFSKELEQQQQETDRAIESKLKEREDMIKKGFKEEADNLKEEIKKLKNEKDHTNGGGIFKDYVMPILCPLVETVPNLSCRDRWWKAWKRDWNVKTLYKTILDSYFLFTDISIVSDFVAFKDLLKHALYRAGSKWAENLEHTLCTLESAQCNFYTVSSTHRICKMAGACSDQSIFCIESNQSSNIQYTTGGQFAEMDCSSILCH